MSHPTAPEGSRCYTSREELDRLSIQLLMVTERPEAKGDCSQLKLPFGEEGLAENE